jgi:hypothetical protein
MENNKWLVLGLKNSFYNFLNVKLILHLILVIQKDIL